MMLTLYDYWRSGTSHRTRIALALKGLSYEHVAIDLTASAQRSDDYLARNPQGLVPALVTDGDETITQSMAIIEWLEESPRDRERRGVRHPSAEQHACAAIPAQNLCAG